MVARGCDVNWGSHGCDLPRGHDPYCRCDCGVPDEDDEINPVGIYPYYGPETIFYGDDVPLVWGLPNGMWDRVPLRVSPRYENDGDVDDQLRERSIEINMRRLLAEDATMHPAGSPGALTPEVARTWAESLWDERKRS